MTIYWRWAELNLNGWCGSQQQPTPWSTNRPEERITNHWLEGRPLTMLAAVILPQSLQKSTKQPKYIHGGSIHIKCYVTRSTRPTEQPICPLAHLSGKLRDIQALFHETRRLTVGTKTKTYISVRNGFFALVANPLRRNLQHCCKWVAYCCKYIYTYIQNFACQ